MPLNISIESWAGLGLFAMLAVFVGLSLARRATERRVSLRDVTRERRARAREEVDIRESTHQLLDRLDAFSREVDGQLDAKLARLEDVTRAADKRIARLEPLLASHDQRAADWAAGRRSGRRGDMAGDQTMAHPEVAGSAPPVGELRAPPARRPDRVEPATPQPALTTAASGLRSVPPRNDPRFAGVYDLADGGVPALDIAARLGIPAGEVELILNLRSLG